MIIVHFRVSPNSGARGGHYLRVHNDMGNCNARAAEAERFLNFCERNNADIDIILA